MKFTKFLFIVFWVGISACVFAADDAIDVVERGECGFGSLEQTYRDFAEGNAGAIEACASQSVDSDSEKVLQALCKSIVLYKEKHSDSVPTLDQLKEFMDQFFDETGLGEDHCYALCENYVSWAEWFQNGLNYTGGMVGGFFRENTAHLNYKTDKLDHVLWLVGFLAALTPYTYPIALGIGLSYYDDIFPGEQYPFDDEGRNNKFLARVAYAGALTSVTALWTRTWMHKLPYMGFTEAHWRSDEALFWAACALPVGAALGYVIDAEPPDVGREGFREGQGNGVPLLGARSDDD